MPSPARFLVALLRMASSRDAANAAIGDVLEEFNERRAAGLAPRRPGLWVNLQTLRAIATHASANAPRQLRSTGLLVRDAWRTLRVAPASSVFIVLVLAIGITAGTVTYSVVDAVVLKPLPLDRPEQLVTVLLRDPSNTSPFSRTPNEVYWRLHDHLSTVEEVAARSTMVGVNVTVAGLSDTMSAYRASADWFPMQRWKTALGRTWTLEDEAAGDTAVAVLGYAFWRDRLRSDPDVLGKEVHIGELEGTYRVIGVLASDTDRPELDITSAPVWIPLAVPRSNAAEASFGITVRMRPGVSVAQLTDDIQRVAGLPGAQVTIKPMLEQYIARFSEWMLLALGAAGMVILIACVNAANLMLTRSAGRQQELAIRASLGASRRHIAGVLITEGLLLSAAATTCAVLLSIGAVRLAKVAVSTMLLGVFRASTIALNGRVLVAAAAVAVVSGLLVSLVPAWQTSRAPLSSLLKDAEGATVTGRRRWRSVFLTAEVATVAVLLVVSWLFVVSLIRVVGIDLGIDRSNLLALNSRVEFRGSIADIEQRLRSLPGVADVAVSTAASLPLIGRAFGGAWHTTKLERADGLPPASGQTGPIQTLQYRVTPNYFSVAGQPFRRGATWSTETMFDVPPIVLDEQVAHQLFGEQDPVGQQVRASEPKGVFTVTGTVAHVYARGPEDPDLPLAYFASRPSPTRNHAGLFVKTTRPAEEMVPIVTEALESLAPDLNEPYVRVADEAVRRITATRRFNGGLMAAFGLVGVLIGAAGVYAVMASFVAQQTREIGVRVALGATPGRIQRNVLAQAWRHLFIGLVLGLPIAWWLSRGFASLLFQVTPADVSVYAGVSAILIVVGLLAAWIPARRAAGIDPIISLRK